MVERRLVQEKQWIDAVVSIATTLKKLEAQGLGQPDLAQSLNVVSALNKIAVTLETIEGHLLMIEGHLLGTR